MGGKPRGVPKTNGMRNLIEAITFVTDSLHKFGVDKPGHSRFAQMKRILKKGFVSCDDSNFDVAREAIRDARIMEFFFDQFNCTEPSTALTETIRRAVADAPLPQECSSKTTGRDAQTELYVAAICAKAKLQPDFVEPDLMLQFDEEAIGIAVKRTKSEGQIEEHIRKGAKQIAKAGVPGHVILDLSVAFNPENTPLIGVRDTSLQQAHMQARRHFADQYFSRIVEWTKDRGVISLILLDSLLREHPTESWTLDSFTYFIPLDQSHGGRQRYLPFRRQFENGLATPAF